MAGAREKGKFEEELKQPIAEKASEYVHPETYTTPHPQLPRSAVLAEYRHVPRAGSQGVGSLVTVREALAALVGVVARRSDLYPVKPSLVAVQKARNVTWPLAFASGDPDTAIIGSLQAALPTFVRAFGDVGNIAYVEQQLHAEALGLKGDSRPAAVNRVKTILNMVNTRLHKDGLKPLVIPQLDELLGKSKVRDVEVGGKRGKVLD